MSIYILDTYEGSKAILIVLIVTYNGAMCGVNKPIIIILTSEEYLRWQAKDTLFIMELTPSMNRYRGGW